MFYIPFWFLLGTLVILAIITVYLKKFRFIDFQALVMFWAIGFSLDMLLCKWLQTFFWVTEKHKGFYSFWACLLFYPSVAIIFIKLCPKAIGALSIYILFWSISLTLFELYVISPLRIVLYPKWSIFPWSLIGYIVVLGFITVYYRIMEKRECSLIS